MDVYEKKKRSSLRKYEQTCKIEALKFRKTETDRETGRHMKEGERREGNEK